MNFTVKLFPHKSHVSSYKATIFKILITLIECLLCWILSQECVCVCVSVCVCTQIILLTDHFKKLLYPFYRRQIEAERDEVTCSKWPDLKARQASSRTQASLPLKMRKISNEMVESGSQRFALQDPRPFICSLIWSSVYSSIQQLKEHLWVCTAFEPLC